MPDVTLTIPGRLPGLNEMIGATNRNRFVGNALKKKFTALCAEYAQLLPQFNKPINISISWIEPNARRDIDNVAAGIKYILDGMVLANKLPNDTRHWVRNIAHSFPEPDKENPRIVISIKGQ